MQVDYEEDIDPKTDVVREITWEAPEHHHIEKGSDWFWALGIITIAAAIAMIVFGNMLFGIVILLAGTMTALISSRKPRMIRYGISNRGIKIGKELHPYSTLKCFYLDEEHPETAQLFVQSKQMFTPLMIIPVPEDAVLDIEYFLDTRLPEEYLKEPLGHRLLELFGF